MFMSAAPLAVCANWPAEILGKLGDGVVWEVRPPWSLTRS